MIILNVVGHFMLMSNWCL